jgi:hypothetical protein
MTSEERALLLRLASRIQVEKDPERFSRLIAELNELLARTEEPMRPTCRMLKGAAALKLWNERQEEGGLLEQRDRSALQ